MRDGWINVASFTQIFNAGSLDGVGKRVRLDITLSRIAYIALWNLQSHD
nr:hypothetical protein [Paenibacillus polymyxa]